MTSLAIVLGQICYIASAVTWTSLEVGKDHTRNLRIARQNHTRRDVFRDGHLDLAEHDSISSSASNCIADIPGTPLIAGIVLFACIAVTGAIIVGLVFYLRQQSQAITVKADENGQPNPQADIAQTVSPPAKKKRIHMHTLDGMRVFLVTAVVFAHYPIGLPSLALHCHGWPMQFFFVLSGFVAQVQQEVGSDRFDWISGLTYITRRLARILPLYQLALAFQFGVAILAERHCRPILAWPLNALLLQVALPVKVCGQPDHTWTLGYTHFNGNGPAWFAACIVWFSCLFPLLYNIRPRPQSQGLWPMVLLGSILILRAVPEILNPQWGHIGHGPHLYAMAPIRLMEYVAGMWAAQAAYEMSQKFAKWSCWCWLFDLSLLLLIAMVYCSLFYLESTWRCSGDYHITAFCCLVCIAARMAAEMDEESKVGLSGAILHRLMGSTLVTYLAPYTFAVYIFQTTFMSWTDEASQNFYIWRFVLLWLFSVCACLYIEEPIRLVVERRLKGK